MLIIFNATDMTDILTNKIVINSSYLLHHKFTTVQNKSTNIFYFLHRFIFLVETGQDKPEQRKAKHPSTSK